MYYVAFVCADDNSIGFTIPDIPGFTADIETSNFDAAVAEATKVFAAHVSEMRAAGIPVPPARTVAEIRDDPTCAVEMAQEVVMLLPLLTPLGRTVRVNLSIDEGTLAIIDREAHDRGVTRSALMQAAVLELTSKERSTYNISGWG